MTRDEYDDALDAVTAALIAYGGGRTNKDASTATHTRGTNTWTLIYLHLLAELKATLQAAGHRYDELADARLIDQADRFDRRTTSLQLPPPTRALSQIGTHTNGASHSRSRQ